MRYIQFVNNGEMEVHAGLLILPASYGAETGSYWIGEQGGIKVTGPRTFEGPVRCEGLLNFIGQYAFHIKDTFDIKGEFRPQGYNWVFFEAGSTPLLDSCMVSVGDHLVFNTGKKVAIDSLRTTYSGAGIATNDTLVIKKYADLTGGTMGGGTGVVIFDGDAEVYVSLGSHTTSNSFQGRIDNYGTFHWKEGTIKLMYKSSIGVAVFNNYGLFLDEINGPYGINKNQGYDNPFFNNYGIYKKKSAFPSGFGSINVVNKETGVITGEGSISFSLPMKNTGSVSPGDSVGFLSLTGEYVPDSASSVNIDIGGTAADTAFDRLEIVGDAGLTGTLNINLLDGYIPGEGEVYEVM